MLKDAKNVIDTHLKASLGSDELVNKWWDSYNLSFGERPSVLWVTPEGKEKVINYVLRHTYDYGGS